MFWKNHDQDEVEDKVGGGEVRGGEVRGGEVRGGEVRGGEVGGGEVRGGEVGGGEGGGGGEVRGGEVRGGEVGGEEGRGEEGRGEQGRGSVGDGGVCAWGRRDRKPARNPNPNATTNSTRAHRPMITRGSRMAWQQNSLVPAQHRENQLPRAPGSSTEKLCKLDIES